MLFYDSRGCALFEAITSTPEYYITRTEIGLLSDAAPSLAHCLSGVDVVELGSGSCRKISILLDALPSEQITSIRYVPVDVSDHSIRESGNTLTMRYPGLSVQGVAADFDAAFRLLPATPRRVYCFLGSTMGNMTAAERARFLASMSGRLRAEDKLIIGADLLKPRDVLERAYNDGSGITAKFNRNILRVVNRLAGTDFEPDAFGHIALFNEERGRIEMYLEALRDMRVRSSGRSWETRIRRGERILTEYSHKYHLPRLKAELFAAGLNVAASWIERRGWYALLCLTKRQVRDAMS